VTVHAGRIAVAVAVADAAGCTAAPATLAPAARTTPSPPSSSPGIPPGSSAAVVSIDSSLLGVLPASVAGAKVQEDSEAETDAVNGNVPSALASSVAAAVAVDVGSGDLVYAIVVRVKDSGLGGAHFVSWRDSFDEGACSGSGGVIGHGETVIDDRQTFVGTCASGLHTYHVWLEDRSILVSATSRGEKRMGEQLMRGLRP
jgi:hypothetical protein